MTAGTASLDAADAPDNVPVGIGLILVAVLLLSSMDAAIKLLGERYPLMQLVFLRSLIGVVPVLAHVAVTRQWHALRTRNMPGHLLRGVFSLCAMGLFFASLQALSLPDATALFFVAPLIMTALSVPLLKEHVGPRRWAAVVVGLCGVLIIVRPGNGVFGWAALLPMGAALSYSLIIVATRFVGRSETAPAMALWYTAVPITVGAAAMPFVWVAPTPVDWLIFAAAGCCGGFGILLLSAAFRLAPVGALAPFDYTALLWAAAWGWLIWSDLPDLWTLVGVAVIAASGLYIIRREAVARRAAKKNPRPGGPGGDG
ncbi:MAG: DMT family transporter [Alphaproteobacteria bacterium]